MDTDSDLQIYYEYVRNLPLFPHGGFGPVELAHVKGIPMQGIGGRVIGELKPRRGPLTSWLVLPVAPEEHQADYPQSIHRIGEEAWYIKHGITRAHVLGYILGNVIRFHAASLEQSPAP